MLAVKDNQSKLCQSIRRAFETEQARAASGHSPRYRLHDTRETLPLIYCITDGFPTGILDASASDAR